MNVSVEVFKIGNRLVPWGLIFVLVSVGIVLGLGLCRATIKDNR